MLGGLSAAPLRWTTSIELVVKFELVIKPKGRSRFCLTIAVALVARATRLSDEGPARGTALQRETVVNHWLTIQAIRLSRPRVALVWPSLRPGD